MTGPISDVLQLATAGVEAYKETVKLIGVVAEQVVEKNRRKRNEAISAFNSNFTRLQNALNIYAGNIIAASQDTKMDICFAIKEIEKLVIENQSALTLEMMSNYERERDRFRSVSKPPDLPDDSTKMIFMEDDFGNFKALSADAALEDALISLQNVELDNILQRWTVCNNGRYIGFKCAVRPELYLHFYEEKKKLLRLCTSESRWITDNPWPYRNNSNNSSNVMVGRIKTPKKSWRVCVNDHKNGILKSRGSYEWTIGLPPKTQ